MRTHLGQADSARLETWKGLQPSRPTLKEGTIIKPNKMVVRRSAFQHASKTRSVWMQEVPRGTAEVADLYIDEIPVRDTPLSTDKCNCTPYLAGNIILLSQQICLTNEELGLISSNSGESLLHIRDPSVFVNVEKCDAMVLTVLFVRYMR